MKKPNSFLELLAVATLTALSAQAQLTGSGTQTDPYLISTPEAWNAFAAYVSDTPNDMTGAYVSVTADIDFTNVTDGITPIGNDSTAFNGNFDGNNHTVSGYAFVSTAEGQGALFGTVGANAVVSNITAAGTATSGIGGTSGTTALKYIGGVVGNLYGTLRNVTNNGTVTSATNYVGGIAARAYSGATFDQCVNNGALSTSYGGSNSDYVGGIVAYAEPATFNQCVNNGNISGSGSAGIVAYCKGAAGVTYSFNQCVNYGDITGKAYLGGISAYQSTVAGNNVCNYVQCVNYGNITATATSAVTSSGQGGISAAHGAGSTYYHCVNYGNVTNTLSTYTGGISGNNKGSANEAYPVTFRGCQNYGNVSSQGNMIAGIVAYVVNFAVIDSCYNYADVNQQNAFGAAGICYTFSGASSSLTNCINYGDVTANRGTSGSATHLVGGIVGSAGSASLTTAVVDNCVNLGNVTLVIDENATALGAGGIAGRAYNTITNCFNAGTVSGFNRVGGIVGAGSHSATSVRTGITSCVNIGMVIAADEGGGGPIIGTRVGYESSYWGDNNSCTDTYYLNDLSWRGTGATVGDNDSIGTGLSVAQLAGRDNGTAWYTADNYSFPVPLIGKDNPDVLTNAAAIVLAGQDTYANVTNSQFYAGNPAGTSWTPSSSIVVINGNDVQVTEKSQIEVTLTNKTASAQQAPATNAYSGTDGVDWILKLNVDEVSGIDDNTLGKVVAQEAYYTLNGVLVDAPATTDGQVYIVVRKYTDGTMNAIKLRN